MGSTLALAFTVPSTSRVVGTSRWPSSDFGRVPCGEVGTCVRSSGDCRWRYHEHGVRDQGARDGCERAHDGIAPGRNGGSSRGILLSTGDAPEALSGMSLLAPQENERLWTSWTDLSWVEFLLFLFFGSIVSSSFSSIFHFLFDRDVYTS